MTTQTAFIGSSQLTPPDITELFPQGLQPERVDSLPMESLFFSVYEILVSMLPKGTQVLNLFEPPEYKAPLVPLTDSRLVIRCFLGQYAYLAGKDFNVPLPELALCSGIGVQQKADGLWIASLNTAYYPESCISTYTNRTIPLLRTFVKAYSHGYVRPDFYLRHAIFYRLPESVTSVTVHNHQETQTSQSKSVTSVTLCPCGCGVTLVGRQKAATPACRKRLERQRKVAA